jgi:hypothetical protein
MRFSNHSRAIAREQENQNHFIGLLKVKTTAENPEQPGRRLGLLDDRLVLFALSVASGVFLVLLLVPAFRGMTFIDGDLLSQNLPFRKFYADCLRLHQSFLWCPYLYGGFYLHGEGQAGMMHPFHLLLYRLVPLKTAFGVEIFASYAFLLAGGYRLFRGWKLCAPAALFGGFLFTFGGTNLVHLRHVNAVAVMAHLPWLLVAIQRIFESERPQTRAFWISAVAILTGSQILLGHPQSVYFSVLIEGAYVVYLMSVQTRWRRLLALMGALAAGLLIGAVQLLPTVAALRDSSRVTPTLEFQSDLSLQPQELVQWINPLIWQGQAYNEFRGTWNFVIYCGGAITLLLFVWILTQHEREETRGRLIWFLGAVGFAGLVLALGKYNLLFSLYRNLPVIGLFRAPSRYIVLTDFAISAGAALALDRLRRMGTNFSLSPFTRRLAASVALTSIATAVVAIVLKTTTTIGLQARVPFLFELAGHLASPRRIAAGALLIVAGAVLFLASARAHRIFYPALAIFAVLDVLSIQGWALAHYATEDPFQYANPPPLAAPGPIQNAGFDDQPILLNYRIVNGYSGMEPASPLSIRSLLYARIMGARAVWDGGWKVLPDSLPLLRLRNQTVLMKNREVLIAVNAMVLETTLMRRTFTPPGYDRELEQITHFDFSNAALVEVPLSLDSQGSGSLAWLEDEPGHMKLVAKVTGTMLATTGVRFSPGWKITLDGKPQNVVRVDGMLLGFTVPAGQHTIECRFDPSDFRYGEMISLCGVIGIILYLATIFVAKPLIRGRLDA